MDELSYMDMLYNLPLPIVDLFIRSSSVPFFNNGFTLSMHLQHKHTLLADIAEHEYGYCHTCTQATTCAYKHPAGAVAHTHTHMQRQRLHPLCSHKCRKTQNWAEIALKQAYTAWHKLAVTCLVGIYWSVCDVVCYVQQVKSPADEWEMLQRDRIMSPLHLYTANRIQGTKSLWKWWFEAVIFAAFFPILGLLAVKKWVWEQKRKSF